MNLVRIWQLARFVIAFVAFRTVGELVIVYFGMGSTGLISAAALAAQHALLVTMLVCWLPQSSENEPTSSVS